MKRLEFLGFLALALLAGINVTGAILPASSATCATFLIAATQYEMNECLTIDTKAIVPAFPEPQKVHCVC